MKTIILSLILSALTLPQSGYSYVSADAKNLLDSQYDAIVDSFYVHSDDSTKLWTSFVPTTDSIKYYTVHYDYGEPPPENWEIAKAIFNQDSTDIRGWSIQIKKEGHIIHSEGVRIWWVVVAWNKDATFFRNEYKYEAELGAINEFNFSIK